MSSENRTRVLPTVLVYAAAWGFVEATLGYLLHLLRRLTPLPGLTAYILFPIGFFLMLAAYRASGKTWSILAVAAVTAAIKVTSGFLPSVDWIFVGNPAISILAEGLIVFGAASIVRFGADWTALPKATAVSIAWRALFLLAVVLLPVQKGILMKGTTALLTFVFVDSLVNGLVIGGALWSGLDTHRLRSVTARGITPVGAAVCLIVAIGAEVAFSAL